MSGLFRRLSSRRSEGPEGPEPPAQAEPGAADAPANAPAEPGGHESLLVDPAPQTRVLRPGEEAGPAEGGAVAGAPERTQDRAPADPGATVHVARLQSPHPPEPSYAAAPAETPMVPVSDLPAGVDPDELAAAPPTSARRSRLRKRVSFLRAAREVLLRDLGGFVYELHRTAGDIEHPAHRRLREIKLARLSRLDTELHELELRLDDVRRHVVVREPGVGGECPNCGELFGSDAHYCANCGLPLTESARRGVAHEHAVPEPAPEPAQSPARDQLTEEYSSLGTEFRRPTRSGEDEQQAQAVTGTRTEEGAGEAAAPPADAPTRVIRGERAAAPETAAGDAEAPDDGAERARAAVDTPRGDAGAEAPREHAEAASGGPAPEPPHDDAEGTRSEASTEPRDDDAQAARGEAPIKAPRDDAEGASGGTGAEAPRSDAEPPGGAAEGSRPAAESAPGEDAAEPAHGAWHDVPGDERNGRDQSYSPMERRT